MASCEGHSESCLQQPGYLLKDSVSLGYANTDTFSLLLPFITSLIVPIVLCVTSWRLWELFYANEKDKSCSLPLPPGSMGFPLIGETVSFIMGVMPFSKARQQTHGNIFKTHILGRPTVRVIGAENVHRILMGEHTLVTTLWPTSAQQILGTGSLSMSSGPIHKQRRKVLLKAFTLEALGSYVSPTQHIVQDIVKKWCSQGQVLAYPACKQLTFAVASRVICGLDFTESEEEEALHVFHEFSDNIFSLPVNLPGTGFNKGLRAREILLKHIDQCIARRRQQSLVQTSQTPEGEADPGHPKSPFAATDALSIVLQKSTEDGEEIPDTDLREICLELLFAGHETTASVACSTLHLLASHGHVIEAAYAELCNYGLEDGGELTYDTLSRLTYVDNVVKEVLRLLPPIGGGFRKALKTFELNGYQIPKGWAIMYSIRETMADSWVSKDAKDFNPDRWQHHHHHPTAFDESNSNSADPSRKMEYFPFGFGGRACAGKDFAKLILKIIVVELVRSCSWRLVNGQPTLKYFPVPHPKDNMPTHFTDATVFRGRANTY